MKQHIAAIIREYNTPTVTVEVANTDRYEAVPRRHIDIHPSNMPLNINQGLGSQEAPWIVGAPMIKSIERTFDLELNKLKNEMRSQ